MAAKIYYQEDCNLSMLEGKTIAIIGYGSQGHAHALNLKESGCNVIIGLYEGSKSWAKAEAQGFEVFTAAEAAKKADIIMILINDEKQAAMYKKDIEPNLEEGNMLMFAHGFAIHFGQIVWSCCFSLCSWAWASSAIWTRCIPSTPSLSLCLSPWAMTRWWGPP